MNLFQSSRIAILAMCVLSAVAQTQPASQPASQPTTTAQVAKPEAKPEPTPAELKKQIESLQHDLKVAQTQSTFYKALAENQKAQVAAQQAAASVAGSANAFKAVHDDLAAQLGCPGKDLLIDKDGNPACPPPPDPEVQAAKKVNEENDKKVQAAAEQARKEAAAEAKANADVHH